MNTHTHTRVLHAAPDTHHGKHGEFGNLDQYAALPTERIYCSTLSQWPRRKVYIQYTHSHTLMFPFHFLPQLLVLEISLPTFFSRFVLRAMTTKYYPWWPVWCVFAGRSRPGQVHSAEGSFQQCPAHPQGARILLFHHQTDTGTPQEAGIHVYGTNPL